MAKYVLRFDAGSRVGFGHGARCLKLGKRLMSATAEVVIVGSFSSGARKEICSQLPSAELLPAGSSVECDVAVIDRMSDPEDPEAVDLNEIELWRKAARAVVVVHSGFSMPALAEDIVVVGYQPTSSLVLRPGQFWGLEYAPVERGDIPKGLPGAMSGHVLLALGGADDWSAHENILRALNVVPWISHVDVLASPVISQAPSWEPALRFSIKVHRGVPSVFPLLAGAEIVIASFGNLCFEALHVGCLLVVVGQKRFQAECGARLAERELCTSAGLADDVVGQRLVPALDQLRDHATDFSARAREAIDGRGIERLGRIVLEAPALVSRCA